MWLEIANSNNNPLYILHHCIECVKKLGGYTETACES